MVIIDKWLKELKKYGKTLKFKSGAMRYILGYAALLVISCILYLLAWGTDWYVHGEPDMKQLLAFLHEIASTSWVAVIGFVASSLVDRNNDGIPDNIEKESETDGKHKP